MFYLYIFLTLFSLSHRFVLLCIWCVFRERLGITWHGMAWHSYRRDVSQVEQKHTRPVLIAPTMIYDRQPLRKRGENLITKNRSVKTWILEYQKSNQPKNGLQPKTAATCFAALSSGVKSFFKPDALRRVYEVAHTDKARTKNTHQDATSFNCPNTRNQWKFIIPKDTLWRLMIYFSI